MNLVIVLALLLVLVALRARGGMLSPYVATAATVELSYGATVSAEAARYGIRRTRILAMILRESMGKAGVVGAAGERGLMQLTTRALKDVNAAFGLGYTWGDMFDGAKNIRAGCAYLALQVRRFGNLDVATQAYNAGPGAVAADPSAGYGYLVLVQQIESTL